MLSSSSWGKKTFLLYKDFLKLQSRHSSFSKSSSCYHHHSRFWAVCPLSVSSQPPNPSESSFRTSWSMVPVERHTYTPRTHMLLRGVILSCFCMGFLDRSKIIGRLVSTYVFLREGMNISFLGALQKEKNHEGFFFFLKKKKREREKRKDFDD